MAPLADASPPLRPAGSNPLAACPQTARHSSYLGPGPDGLACLLQPDRAPTAEEAHVHAVLVDKVLGASFPCVAARSVFNRAGYRFGLYDRLGSRTAASAVCHDLYAFSHEFHELGDRFATFVAVFRAPLVHTELQFEQLLWRQLQRMHDVDARFFGWNATVSSDPRSAEFSFSIGERAFFPIGMNPCASRHARTAPWSMIAFNLHEQFERLRARGKYEPLKAAIRARDLALQGSLNPVLANFGDTSETRQYSGRAVTDSWRCPFHARAGGRP